MSEAYYRKWRPMDWESLIGQAHIVQTLKNAILHDRIAHAYLFSGPRGTGKTSTARIIAKAVNCLASDRAVIPCNACENCQAINSGRFMDLIEIDAASNTSVDDVRSLREKINYSPTQGTYKVYIIDEVHMLSNAAFNALLKTLEEPPDHAIFVLATTEVHKIPATVLSRCQRHEFRRIPIKDIQENLEKIVQAEGITIDAAALTEIARQATGSMRDAVSLLDQLASAGDSVTLAYTKEVLGTAGNDFVTALVAAILEKNAGAAISVVNQSLDSGSDPRQFGRQIVDYLRNMLLVKMGNSDAVEETQETIEQLATFSQKIPMHDLISAIEMFDSSTQNSSLGWQPSLQLELAVMRLCGDHQTSISKESPQKNILDPDTQSLKKSSPPSVNVNETQQSEKKEMGKKTSKDPEKEKKPTEKIDLNEDGINVHWDNIKQAAKTISGETGALLNSCRAVQVSGQTIILEFSSSILQSKMENGNNMENAKSAINQVTHTDYAIRCEVAGKRDDETTPINVDREGMIGEALSLGGKMRKEE